jgi:pyruvate formate lyase activating enzyme
MRETSATGRAKRASAEHGRSPEWAPAMFHRREGEKVRCVLCPRACLLGEGDVGFCGVRRCHGGGIETATFAASVCQWGPVERKPLYHVRPGARALTLAAPGCTFRCKYCLNYRLSQYGRSEGAQWDGVSVNVDDVVHKAASQSGLIALSYSEPILAAELTLALARHASGSGVGILWKSNGFVTEAALATIAPCLLAANIDIKTADEDKHLCLTGAPLAPVLAAVRGLVQAGVWVEISTPVIPGFNADDASLGRLAQTILAIGADVPWHLVRFMPAYKLQEAPPASPSLLRRAREIARREGVRFVYVERALGKDARNTYCHRCGAVLIRRGIWCTEEILLRDGQCPQCHSVIPGRWL